MAATYRQSTWRRLLNALVPTLLLVGLGPRRTYLLTVRGRRSGKPYSTPVTLVEEGTNHWLIAPYGKVAWVRNARVAGQVTLSRGHQSETVGLVELGPEESAPVLKQSVTEVPITCPFFDVTPDAPFEAFVAEAHRHPVFRIHGVAGSMSRTPPSAFRQIKQMPTFDPGDCSLSSAAEARRALKNPPSAAEYTHKGIPGARLHRRRA
jgi:deazaflavin-dependent oxidoreductase (nitroreductase family)